MQHDITQFGAVGDGDTNSTTAIQSALDHARDAGGGTVIVPAGRFVTGSLTLGGHTTLHLDAGAVLLGSQDPDDFPLYKSDWEGPGVKPTRRPLIGGEGASHVSVTGRGIIDARGQMWWDSQKRDPGKLRRPLSLRFIDCTNVLVEGITFRNSPMWTVSPLACDNVTIRGITIQNPDDSPNTDGINPDSCRNVHISDCHIDVGDDCITIKSGKEDDGRRTFLPCENITVSNCTLVRGHGGVVMGSEITGDVRNVVISNCVFVGTDRGIRLKARRGRGGVIEDVRVSNLVMQDVGVPITMNLFYGCGAWDDPKVVDQRSKPVDDTTPIFRRLRFSGITARGAKWAALYALGLPEMPIDDVRFDDLSITMDPDSAVGQPPIMAPHVDAHVRRGAVLRHLNNLTLADVRIIGALGEPVTVLDSAGVQVR